MTILTLSRSNLKRTSHKRSLLEIFQFHPIIHSNFSIFLPKISSTHHLICNLSSKQLTMKAFNLSSPYIPSVPYGPTKTTCTNMIMSSNCHFSFLTQTSKKLSPFKHFCTISSSSSAVSVESIEPPQPEFEDDYDNEKFDWYSQWYPIMPVCDLDKRVPHAKKVMGVDVVVWWDRNESAWRVFDDACPHRLAPLSEGRIDQWGRLQCVYHGWCFGGSGDCKFIPQAPLDGPPVHTFKKACVGVYPSTVQNDIVWFWPNTDPKYKDILSKKKPPYIPELDDPSFTKLMANRDIPYGYEVLVENLMDPAHVPYAHYGIMRIPQQKVKADREGGRPLDMKVQKLDINGFTAKQQFGESKFFAPCVYYSSPILGNQISEVKEGNGAVPSAASNKSDVDMSIRMQSSQVAQRRALLIFICVPVSPGKSRLIWSFPRNFGVWIDKIVPRWFFHIGQNLILDSDLYLLHVEERKIMDVGPTQWQKACFVPTKSDAYVVSFRRWLNRYSCGQVDWGGTFTAALPPTPPREQLMDRYWTHVVNCRSCSTAYKGFRALEISLQVISIASIGIVAAVKNGMMAAAMRTTLVSIAVICFAASRWLSHFIYKNFHYHDYNHALR